MSDLYRAWKWISHVPLTPIFGAGRSLIALGLLITVSFDGTEVLFAPDTARFPLGRCGNDTLLDSTLFCLTGFEVGRWLAIIIFLCVMLGYFPALTAIPFAYAAWSLQSTLAIPEGGDQLASNLAIIMIPASLMDWRLSQWSSATTDPLRRTSWQRLPSLIRGTTVLVLWGQMAIVYFFAAVEKFAVEEWKDGTALFYWSTDPNFGATGVRLQILELLSTNSLLVVALTWGTLVLELLLAFAWMAQWKIKRALLVAGVIFHLGIALFMGLISFSIIMCGALLIYLGTSSRNSSPVTTESLQNVELDKTTARSNS